MKFESKVSCWLAALLLAAAAAGCAAPPSATPTLAPPTPSEDPRQATRELLEEAFEVIEEESYYSDSIDWPTLRADVFGRLDQASDPHALIEYLLSALGDNHSHMMDPQQADDYWNSPNFMDFPEPWGAIQAERYGYLWMGGFASGDPEITNAYASRLQQIVIELDGEKPCAWVLDLRENNGGDIYAMVAGLGELIGDGLVMQSANRQGEFDFQLFYRDGAAMVEDEVIAQAAEPDFSLTQPGRPILVLIGRGTISSGEALSLAFKGNPGARSMGHETAGLTTGNSRIELSDGTLLFITSSVDADPTGQLYGGTIKPEIPFKHTGYFAELGTIPQETLDWLEENVSCGP